MLAGGLRLGFQGYNAFPQFRSQPLPLSRAGQLQFIPTPPNSRDFFCRVYRGGKLSKRPATLMEGPRQDYAARTEPSMLSK